MATPQTFGPQPFDKKKFLQERFSPEEADVLLAGGTPNYKDTLKQAPLTKPNQAPVKAGAGMAQKGLSVHPDALEAARAEGKADDAIADLMAQSSPHFASQLTKIRKKFAGDPAATTAFLNSRLFGDTSYSPSKPTESKGYLGRTLDRIYQSAQDFVGPGGYTDQMNRGELSPGQAILKGAGSIYHGATAPVSEGIASVANAAMQIPGVQPALQSVGRTIADSELGKAAAPIIQEGVDWYQNLPQDSGFRDLAVVGQAGLDTLDVLGAGQGIQSLKTMGKGAAQTIRHPIQAFKGKPIPQTATRELQGPAKAAVKSGMDERLMTFAAEQNPDTRAVMAKMTQAASEGGKVLGGTTKHKEILGGQMMDNLAYILDEKKHVGQALGAMKKAVADDMFDLTDDYLAFLGELRNKGAVINDRGVITSLAGAADDNIPLLQKTLDFLMPNETGRVVQKGQAIDLWRTKMFQEMNSAKAKLQPSTAGQSTLGFAEKITNDVRRRALTKMSAGNKNMILANDAFEELSTEASKFLKSIQYKGKLDIDSITAKELRAGEVALRTLGNASADSKDAFMSLIETARKHGRISNIDEMALIRYADALEDLFPITQPRSLQGAVGRGTADATGQFTEDVIRGGVKRAAINRAADAVIEKLDKIRGITPENRFKLLMEVLEAPPETEFFTIVQKVLPMSQEQALMPTSQRLTAGDMAPYAKQLVPDSVPVPKAIQLKSEISELEFRLSEAKQMLDANGPDAFRYANKRTGELPEVTGKGGRFASEGDDIASQHGYQDSEDMRSAQGRINEARDSVKEMELDLANKKQELRSLDSDLPF